MIFAATPVKRGMSGSPGFLAEARLRAAAHHALSSRLRTLRIACPSEGAFALATSAIWVVFYNPAFWERTMAAMWQPSAGAVLFLASLLALLVAVHAGLLLLVPTRRGMRLVASAFFVVAATGSYFASAYGTPLDEDMLRNVAQSDLAEVADLMSFGLVLHVVLMGVVPALLVWRVELPATRWDRRILQRAAFVASAFALALAGLLASSASAAVFFREYKAIRYSLVPLTPVTSAVDLGIDTWRGAHQRAFVDSTGRVERMAPPGDKPLVLFVVVGETARAASFQLGGYERATNPRLSAIDRLVYFDHASSCGTSTAISVPCMFSSMGRAHFDAASARARTNVLDSLVKAGFDVQWRDNNAGCKGVCARIPAVVYDASRNGSEPCPHAHCYDEVVLSGLADEIERIERDTVIVFHLNGSHGPAYAERYPPEFERFTPACRSNQLQRCTPEEIINAYDNTIAYTDDVLARQIELLQAAEDRVDSLLIYVSDHGESLGEQGLYLHGMPYAIAPPVQTGIPLFVWPSRGYAERTGLDVSCLRSTAHEPVSHDNVYHTLLGAAQVRDEHYDPARDLLRACHSG